jgi:hypothetical protein
VDVEHALLGERLPGDEEDRRDPELVEDGQRQVDLAAQAVVEGDDARALRERMLARDRREQVVARDELPRAAEQLELCAERADRDGEDRPWASRRLGGDVVVTDREEDEAR